MVSTATAATTLDAEAFNQMVLEKSLTTWEQNGYIYAGFHGPNGWELYRAYGPKWRWVYTARRIAQQTNAGGGAIAIDITCAAGQAVMLGALSAFNSGNNGLYGQLVDEDNAEHSTFASIGAAAATKFRVPSGGGAASSTGNIIDSNALYIPEGIKLTIGQTAAGVQNDTLTVAVTLILPISAASDGSDVSWSTARSTNPGDVTLAASTISSANTMKAVLMV